MFSWFGEKENPNIKEKTGYNCIECKNLIVNGLKEINGTFNIEERKNLILRLIEKGKSLSCGCYEKFINELENDDGKNYEIRYKKFMNKSKKREFSSEI